jgi:hypothetical protein
MGDAYHQSCVDITISSSICPSHLQRQLYSTVESRSLEKIRKHASNCRSSGYGFIPLALDACGIVSKQTSSFISRCASAAADRNGLPLSVQIAYFRRRISFAIQLGVGMQLSALALTPLTSNR